MTEPGRCHDGGGLYLQMSGRLTKAWMLRYSFAGVARHLGLGPFPKISLLDARKLAAQARMQLQQGIDPAVERHERKRAAKQAREQEKIDNTRRTTFAQCVDAYLKMRSKRPEHARAFFILDVNRAIRNPCHPFRPCHPLGRPASPGLASSVARQPSPRW